MIAEPQPTGGIATQTSVEELNGSPSLESHADETTLIPVRMLNEFTYCPRLGYLEWVQGEWADNLETRQGTFGHKQVDHPDRKQFAAPADGEVAQQSRPDFSPATCAGVSIAAAGEVVGSASNEQTTGDVKLDYRLRGNDVQGSGSDNAPTEKESIHARSIMLSAPREGLLAKLDLLEIEGQRATPVDYKRGKVPDVLGNAYDPERVQLCAQGLILRENGYQCDEGVLYFIGSKRRVVVPFDDELIGLVRSQVLKFKQTAAAGLCPPPLIDSPKCPRCSLVTICLPDETNFLRQIDRGDCDSRESDADREGEAPAEPRRADWLDSRLRGNDDVAVADDLASGACQPAGFQRRETDNNTFDRNEAARQEPRPPETLACISSHRDGLRRLLPANDDALPLYVQEFGAYLGKSGDRLVVTRERKELASVRLLDVSQVCLFGNVTVSSPVLKELTTRGIPICHFTYGGWFHGITTGLVHNNVELRIRQYAAATNPAIALTLAKAMIAGKIKNCRTLLRRHLGGRDSDDPQTWEGEAPAEPRMSTQPAGLHPPLARHRNGTDVLRKLADYYRRVRRVESAESLLGLEGMAAKEYFAAFFPLIDGDHEFDVNGRNRRPPRDPVNAVLSFVYSLLSKELTITLQAVGFDPLLGFYHRPRFSRPSLALDLAEEFRPLIADSVTLTAFNNGEVTRSSFLHRAGGVTLTDAGRKAVLSAYERRLATEITHPIFGYRISYRRILEVQARLLARTIAGEIPEYPNFCTR